MDNRKIIVAFNVAVSMLLWFLTRAAVQYFYLGYYQVRRIPGILIIREALPILAGAILFIVLLTNTKIAALADEVVSELKKVTWPARDDVVRSTIVVLICVVIASLILGAFDVFFGKMIGFALKG